MIVIDDPAVRSNQSNTSQLTAFHGQCLQIAFPALFQTHFYKSGFLTFPEYISNCAVRVAASILPVGIRGYLYQKKLRERMHA